MEGRGLAFHPGVFLLARLLAYLPRDLIAVQVLAPFYRPLVVLCGS